MSRSIVTKTGDAGQTKLIYGHAVSKADLRVEAYGTLDELNSFLGLARSLCADVQIKTILENIQRESFTLSTELATPPEHLPKLKARITSEMTKVLEEHIAPIEARPGLLDDWALPGAITASAALDVARTVCRRAERCVVRLHEAGEVPNEEILRYLNRLSDLLWLLGRKIELDNDVNGALRS